MNFPRTNYPCNELSSYKWSLRWIVLKQIHDPCNELFMYKWSLQGIVHVQMILAMNCPRTNDPCNKLSSYKWSLQWIVLIRIIFAMNCPCTNDLCNNRQFEVQNFHRASDKLNVSLSINPRDLVCISCPEKHAFVLPDSAVTAEHPGGGWWISRSASGIREKSGSSSARR